MNSTGLDTLGLVAVGSCIASVCGALAIILTLLVFPKQMRKAGHRLLFWLSVSDLLTSASYLTNVLYFGNDDTCKYLAVVDIYFPVVSFLWTDCIGVFVYVSVTRLRRIRHTKGLTEIQIFILFHVICWVVPVSTVL